MAKADSRHSTKVRNRVAKLKLSAPKVATDLMMSVRVTANVLADMMADMHGGSWRVSVDHNMGFVLIAVNPDTEHAAITKPSRGEIA